MNKMERSMVKLQPHFDDKTTIYKQEATAKRLPMELFDIGADPCGSETNTPTTRHNNNRDDDFQYWLSRLQKNGLDLQYVPRKLRSNKTLITTAVEECGCWALQYAISPDNDLQKKKPLKSLDSRRGNSQDNAGLDRHSHHQSPKESHQYWLSRVSKNGLDLQHAPKKIRGNKQIVMAAVQECGWALEHALPSVQQDKDVVIVAVSKSSGTIKHASPVLQNDSDVIDAAVRKSGRSRPLRYASEAATADVCLEQPKKSESSLCLDVPTNEERDEKSDIMAALTRTRNKIKVIHEAIQVASGIVDEVNKDDEEINSATSSKKKKKKQKKKKKIVFLSTRSSLNEDPTFYSDGTRFTKFLKESKYVRSSKLQIYDSVQLINRCDDTKKIDDSNSNRMESSNRTPCRCQSEDTIKTGHLSSSTGGESCHISWAEGNEDSSLQLRNRLQDAKDTGGFMLQLVETGESYSRAVPTLSNMQRIEHEISQDLQMKIFQVYKPRSPGNVYETYFAKRHIKDVVSVIQDWYDGSRRDMSECVIRPSL